MDWNCGDLESYLIEITGKILEKKDDLTDNGYVTDYVRKYFWVSFSVNMSL